MKCFCSAGIAFLKTLGYNLAERIKNKKSGFTVNWNIRLFEIRRVGLTIRKGEFQMKVTHITDIDEFFKVIDSCKGRVELVTGEGDRLNLKSKLSQYVSLANIFSGGEIPELEIVAAEKEDIDKLMSFMING